MVYLRSGLLSSAQERGSHPVLKQPAPRREPGKISAWFFVSVRIDTESSRNEGLRLGVRFQPDLSAELGGLLFQGVPVE
ncbi:uncharacterized protein METZ01_LOCUS459956 [marine metagenome]|uniref:Uncharacterized protein n=1 Tax=marine metagenome TaxID=408172 RepID=A0A383AH56_9ZZZZ